MTAKADQSLSIEIDKILEYKGRRYYNIDQQKWINNNSKTKYGFVDDQCQIVSNRKDVFNLYLEILEWKKYMTIFDSHHNIWIDKRNNILTVVTIDKKIKIAQVVKARPLKIKKISKTYDFSKLFRDQTIEENLIVFGLIVDPILSVKKCLVEGKIKRKKDNRDCCYIEDCTNILISEKFCKKHSQLKIDKICNAKYCTEIKEKYFCRLHNKIYQDISKLIDQIYILDDGQLLIDNILNKKIDHKSIELANIYNQIYQYIDFNAHVPISSIQSSELTQVTEKTRYKKKTIPKTVRDRVWRQFFLTLDGHCCCCKCPISIENFHCGHVVAEKEGGANTIDNLRPICQNCNLSMGTKNMDLFIEQHGF